MSAKGKIKVLSTTAMIDDIVGQIAGERVEHIPLITGQIDPHGYELVKGDDEKLCFADVIFYNGLGLEHGASLRYGLLKHPCAIELGKVFQENLPDALLYVGGQIDPHIWMDISLWREIVDPIAQTLARADPQASQLYYRNAEALKQKMDQEHKAICNAFRQIPQEKRYLVTSHDAFSYFTRAYLAEPNETCAQWQERFHAPEGLAPDSQLSASDIQKIVEHLIHTKVTIVFPESNVSVDSLKKIVHACRQKGLQVAICPSALYGDSMGGEGSGAENYLKMIRHDADVIIQGWQSR